MAPDGKWTSLTRLSRKTRAPLRHSHCADGYGQVTRPEGSARERLLAMLQREVDAYSQRCAALPPPPSLSGAGLSSKISTADARPCALCPCYVAASIDALLSHVSEQHTFACTFVPSGTKQLRVVCALYDDDMCADVVVGHFLSRSANVMRRTLQGSVPASALCIDRYASLVLRHSGPQYEPVHDVTNATSLRRVGYVAYDRGFAVLLLREFLAHRGRLRPTRRSVTARTCRQPGALPGLLPARLDVWLRLLEDTLRGPTVSRIETGLLRDYVAAGEFQHISIDATFRIMFNIRGQARFNWHGAPAPHHLVSSRDAKRRLLTVVGMRSSLLLASPVVDESGPHVAAALQASFPEDALSAIRTVRTDAPSRSCFDAIRSVCPSLDLMALDPVHISMRYEAAHGGRRTEGSRVLRKLMGKFCVPAAADSVLRWGPAYRGDASLVTASALSSAHRRSILSQDLSRSGARATLESIALGIPWTSPEEATLALASFSVWFQSELRRTPPGDDVRLVTSLYRLASPTNLQWLFNNSRLLRQITPLVREFVPVGTTSNEAVHAEFNKVFANQPESFASTVAMQARCVVLAKGLAHSTALLRPLLRQNRSADILSRALDFLDITEIEWRDWCATLRFPGLPLSRARLPEARRRQLLAKRLAAVARARRGGSAPFASAGNSNERLRLLGDALKNRKRTVFTRRPIVSLKRLGSSAGSAR